MKKCSYCGRDNADEALNCRECGCEFEFTETPPPPTLQAEEKTLVIRIFSDHEQAQVDASKLESHSIKCWVAADDCGGMYPGLTAAEGVRLRVLESDAHVAIALLDAQPSPAELKQIEVEAVLAKMPVSTPGKKLAWGQIAVGVFLGIIICLLYQSKGIPGTTTHYHYNAAGKRDEAYIYRDGQLIEYEQDRNLDGAWDHWVFYAHGRRVRSVSDNNFDGKPDVWWTFGDDGIDRVQKDTDFNGIPDVYGTYKWGVIQQSEMRPNGSKFATKRDFYKNGVLTVVWRGGDSNGNFSESVRYDPFLNPISTNLPPPVQAQSIGDQ
jgi:hypothetical protein